MNASILAVLIRPQLLHCLTHEGRHLSRREAFDRCVERLSEGLRDIVGDDELSASDREELLTWAFRSGQEFSVNERQRVYGAVKVGGDQ